MRYQTHKIVKRMIIFSFFGILLSGCLKEDEDYPGKTGTPLIVSAVMVPGAGNTRSFSSLSGGSMGVFLVENNDYKAQNNIQYNYSSGGWVSNTNIYLYSKIAAVCAYFPYDPSVANPVAVTLTSQLYDENKDLCYATNVSALSSNAPDVTFNMSRAYSQITFALTRDPAYSGVGAVSQIQITNPGILSASVLDITAGTYGAGIPGTVSYNPGISGIASGTSVNSSVLMVPVTTPMTGKVSIACMVDGQTMKADLPVVVNNLTTLDVGKNYQVAVALKYSPESNCYMVKPNGTVYIPVSRANTGAIAAGLPVPISNATDWTTGLLWTDNVNVLSPNGVVASIVPDPDTPNGFSGHIKVTAGSTTGNAVVYVKVDNTIVWSWHIWVTDYDPNTNNSGTTYVYNNGFNTPTFMDRNLGAISATPTLPTTQGLLYQWGRKDPFPGSESILSQTESVIYNSSGRTTVDKEPVSVISNQANAIKNPLTFYFSNNYLCDWYTNSSDSHSQNDALWGGVGLVTPILKTVFDPCPPGWCVPACRNNMSPWNGLTSLGGIEYARTEIGYYPATGFRDNSDGVLSGIGLSGGNWTASATGSSAYNLFVTGGQLNPLSTDYRAAGLGVRCVKN